MKLVSWNVNGIRAVAKKGLSDIIKGFDAEIICLQETKATVDQVKEVLAESPYFVYANEAERKGYSGTAILAKHAPLAVSYGIGIAVHDAEGRVITAEFDDFYVVNAYVPNAGSGLKRLDYRAQWDKDLRAYLSGLDALKPVLFCGDLNVCHQPIDIARPKANYNKSAGYTQVEIDGIGDLLAAGFTDSYRSFFPDTVKYSWWSYRGGARGKNIGWRLDYVLVSDRFMSEIEAPFILNEIMGSDHCPVGLSFS